MSIRTYSENDYSLIAEIYNQSKLDELKNESITFNLLPLTEDKIRLKELMESNIFVYDSGHVMAFGAYYKSEIRALFVHPNHRGKGIGKKLLEFMLLQLAGVVTLNVAKTNSAAKSMYAKFGFKVTNEFKTKYNGVSVMANTMSLVTNNG